MVGCVCVWVWGGEGQTVVSGVGVFGCGGRGSNCCFRGRCVVGVSFSWGVRVKLLFRVKCFFGEGGNRNLCLMFAEVAFESGFRLGFRFRKY